jgi:hypothetical protein
MSLQAPPSRALCHLARAPSYSPVPLRTAELLRHSRCLRSAAVAAAKAADASAHEPEPSTASELRNLRELSPLFLPRDKPEMRARVVGAVGLLLASKARAAC